jgi:hypothetical protein
VRLLRRAAAGHSPTLQGGGGEIPRVTVVGAGMVRRVRSSGRASVSRTALWQSNLEVRVAPRSDLVGGGGGSFGRHGVAGRQVLSCGGRRVTPYVAKSLITFIRLLIKH